MHSISPSARALPGSVSQIATPTKSILKTASVLGRRKHQLESGSDTLEASDTPNKRRKVIIDEIQNTTHEVGRRTMEDIKLEVKTALEGHLRGNDDQYDTLKEIFAKDMQKNQPLNMDEDSDAPKPHELRAYIIALASSAPILKDKQCKGLVRIILQCSWLGRDDAFTKAFIHFLAALVSAQGSYLAIVLDMVVDKFRLTRQSSWSVPNFPPVSRDVMRQRIHSALQYLMQIFPSAIGVLEDTLNARFPLPNDSIHKYMVYINNLFKVKEYLPDLQDDILDMILNRVVRIDAQMQLDFEDIDDTVTTAVLFALRENSLENSDWEQDELDASDDESESDDESVDSETESVGSDNLHVDETILKVKTIKDQVEKMDAVLDTLFKFHTPFFLNPGSDKAFDAFTIILREFDQIILPVSRSRHTQFLIFHFAQQHERLTDAFCGQLIATAFQNNAPSVLKQAAAAYLASFVARGARVPRDLVRTIFTLLLYYLEQYRRKFEPICQGPDLKRFQLYYSLMQAALYIFCFRWKDLVTAAPDVVDTDDVASYIGQDLEWIGSSRKDLSAHIYGKLNPLKVCAPQIVEEFAKLAHRLNFMYVYPLVESNKRVRLTQFLSVTYRSGGAIRDTGRDDRDEDLHQLDLYFPFDPYQLPVSKRWLNDDYVHWKALPDLNAEKDSDDGEDVDDNDEDGLEEGTATDSDGDDL